ncbi:MULTISPECIES: BNR-4 repeat-containing protein [unclassified Carboxylicivirga]|uniref:BNR-4 repeat-containing protein n=1 Tax=Carboxylicivirga TaxID=1628153 RepID=UPI003D333569
MKNTIKLLVNVLVLLLACSNLFSQESASGYLTKDGGWCWFSDPRAIYVDGNIITGWVKKNGTIEAASFSAAGKEIKTKELFFRLEADDHDNPAFVETGDGRIVATYTRHSTKKEFYFNSTTKGADISSFDDAKLFNPGDKEEIKKFPREHVTYANPCRLEAEDNRIYCFGRWTGYKPNMMWSDDNGLVWTKSKVFITNYPFDDSNRPYVKYYSDGKSKIHIVFTDGHPRNEPTNSVYYACYEKGAFYRADGSKITDMDGLPFEPKDASVIYRSNKKEGRAWIADIAQDKHGNPVVLYTKSPKETDHRYFYARFAGSKWISSEICKAGKWFPETPRRKKEPEPHYFGGMVLHPANANVVYLSREVKGTFEIERRETNDGGKTWEIKAITKNSKLDNVRPYVPRGLKENEQEVVLWMENQKYIHYTDFDSAIKYSIWNN